MAISCAYTTKSGISLPNAYFKIRTFSGDKLTVTFHVDIYTNADCRRTKDPIDSLRFIVSYSEKESTGILAALYGELKKQTGFENAKDV